MTEKKEVLISIRPEWCDLILTGAKELEIRRTRPKIEPPFKCHIYCTKYRRRGINGFLKPDGNYIFGNGNVIADFICDKIIDIGVPYPAYSAQMNQDILKAACMSYSEMHRYAGHDTVYGLHISDLHIFDHSESLDKYGVKRAPQSWCYVDDADPLRGDRE